MWVRLIGAALVAAVLACGVSAEAHGEARAGLRQPRQPERRLEPGLKQAPVIGAAMVDGVEFQRVSTSTKCVINLTLQFLMVYTAVAICRSLADCFSMEYKKLAIEKILRSACLTVNYAPMLAVLFLGCRLRVLWLSQGTGNPPEWMQKCMYGCTYAVLLLTLVACIIPLFTGEAINVDPRTGSIREGERPFENVALAWCFSALKFLSMLLLYAGVFAIIYGIVTYEPPQGSWHGREKTPPVSTVTQCIILLTVQFFIVYAFVQVARSFTQLAGYKETKFENAMLSAAESMNLAPVLGILFIASRMRSLQMEPIYGAPQAWTKRWFYFCTFALAGQTLVSFIVPLVLQGKVRAGRAAGDVEYEVRCYPVGLALINLRFLILLSIYAGVTLIVASIFTMESSWGPSYTAPISATMQCVINLSGQFLLVHLLCWIGHSMQEITSDTFKLLMQTMDNAKATVQMCPMLAILFVGCRIRALQITKSRGAPQEWVQDAMYVATGAVLVQTVACLIAPYFSGQPLRVGHDGKVTWKPQSPKGFATVQCVRWIAFVVMYAGIITVIVGIFMMTPGTATGSGSMPLVGDDTVAGI